jgi:ribonuclease BN (tRNA processing enzyme)
MHLGEVVGRIRAARFVLRKFAADVGTLTPGNAWLRDAMRLSQLNVNSVRLNALFFTHMHSDHTEGFADFMHHRWAWDSRRPKLDIVCNYGDDFG